MSWYYQKFPSHSVAAETFEIRGRNTITLYYNYMVDPNIGKGVCVIFRILCACKACVAQLDKYWLPNCAPSSQPMYARVENFYYNKVLEY